MAITDKVPINLNEIRCVRCLTCYRACPFEAILLKDGKISLDVEKCQLCGVCASLCPTYNIELAYYDNEWLMDHVKRQKEELGTNDLVVMCRGSSPQSCDILDVLKEQGIATFIPLRLPCVGRVPAEFYLDALSAGIEKLIVVQCDEASCRFKKGSENSTKNISRLQALLKEVGYEDNVLTFITDPSKAVYDTDKCVGCDKCEFICPYDAIEAQPLATPLIIFEQCKACGACALVCPHLAIQLEGFEFESSSQAIQQYKTEVAIRKAKGISPMVLVFCCQWAEFSALDRAGDGFLGDNALIIEIPCVNGLDPVQVLNAFNAGFDGVLALVCPKDDCKSKEGRDISEGNIAALEKVLKSMKLTDRFDIQTISPRNMGEFNSRLESFIDKISSQPKIISDRE